MVPSALPLALVVMLSFSGGAFFFDAPKENSIGVNILDELPELIWDYFVKKIVGTIESILNWISEKLVSLKGWIENTFFTPVEPDPNAPLRMGLYVIWKVAMVLLWFVAVRSFLWIAKWWIWLLDVLPIA